MVNDFSISVATVNGSGSQSANNILMRTIFRMGIPVEGKNIFPSNIAGLPTWFSIRVNDQGFTSRRRLSEIFVCLNLDTFAADLGKVKEGGWFFYSTSKKIDESIIPKSINSVAIDFNQLAGEVSSSIQLKKLLANIIYVGVLSELLQIPQEILEGVIKHQFKGKEQVFEVNKQALERGQRYAQENLKSLKFPYRLEARNKNDGKILIDGNTAAGLGCVSAGCTFASWYPITPSSSLAENFESYCYQYRIDKQGKHNFSVLQAEDELSAIAMVAGAGWAGARAMTMTSGPGISLMSECVGLMYFAEIPGVIWDVQRMGPSTGLPTRVSQGDLMAAAYSSHGDSRHPVLLPNSPRECFEMAHTAFDMAEELQTLVFVLSDLDLGMNFWTTEKFKLHTDKMNRGKVLNKADLEKRGEFARYKDVDGDGIPYRTLPGTEHDLAAYFTRGTGHTPAAKYSEDDKNYKQLLDRLSKKWETIKKKVPKPELNLQTDATLGLIYFGSTSSVVPEVIAGIKQPVSLCRIKAFPFTNEVLDFLRTHERVIVLEQNEMGQMAMLLRQEFPEQAVKIRSVRNYDGLSLDAEEALAKMQEALT